MQTDYVGTQFKKAEQKLKKALAQCGASSCTPALVARLHRDLATVYIGGLNQKTKGRAELKKALQADPELQLDEQLATDELRKTFKALGGHEPKPREEEPKPTSDQPDADCEPGTKGCKETEKEKEEPAEEPVARSTFPKNWLSLHFEQDFLLFSAQDNVCASFGRLPAEHAGYSCYQSGAQFGYAAGQEIQPGAGNRISGGLGRATPRVLLGFDRLLTSNLSLGLRLGFAFNGGPAARGKSKFQPLHAELRVNYWFGKDPFASSGLRPYVSLSGGMAQIDGHVVVEYYNAQGQKGTLDAWRTTGKGFAGLGLGLMIPIGSSGLIPELRALQLFGNSGTVFAAALGYAYGF